MRLVEESPCKNDLCIRIDRALLSIVYMQWCKQVEGLHASYQQQ